MTRVALPTNDGHSLAHFGVARTYAIYEVEAGRVAHRQERANPDPDHQAPNHHKLVLDQVRDCQVVIAEHMGPPMVRSLQHLGIRVLRAPSLSLAESVQAYLRDPDSLRDFSVQEAAPPPGHAPHGDHDEHDGHCEA
ncbi:MAG: hypothetical protein HY690_07015 [Chloroflexi bacterium]|nr:hypothetical protein [Chloroflexota bacterium]